MTLYILHEKVCLCTAPCGGVASTTENFLAPQMRPSKESGWDLVHAGVTDKQVPAGNSF